MERCSAEEKESVFKEVVPHALRLMTDIFGNYVIQKVCFENFVFICIFPICMPRTSELTMSGWFLGCVSVFRAWKCGRKEGASRSTFWTDVAVELADVWLSCDTKGASKLKMLRWICVLPAGPIHVDLLCFVMHFPMM